MFQNLWASDLELFYRLKNRAKLDLTDGKTINNAHVKLFVSVGSKD